jgi:integrase
VWVDRGGDLRVLAEILGHSNPATTAIYSRADEKRRRQGSISGNGVACQKRVVLWVKSG